VDSVRIRIRVHLIFRSFHNILLSLCSIPGARPEATQATRRLMNLEVTKATKIITRQRTNEARSMDTELVLIELRSTTTRRTAESMMVCSEFSRFESESQTAKTIGRTMKSVTRWKATNSVTMYSEFGQSKHELDTTIRIIEFVTRHPEQAEQFRPEWARSGVISRKNEPTEMLFELLVFLGTEKLTSIR
jgi:hypothetical protein